MFQVPTTLTLCPTRSQEEMKGERVREEAVTTRVRAALTAIAAQNQVHGAYPTESV